MSEPRSLNLSIEGMICASCVGRVDRALAAVPGVLDVNVNLAAGTATVTYLEGAVSMADLLAAARGAGYPAKVADAANAEDRGDRKLAEARIHARRTVVAAALALPVFLLEMGGHVIPGFHDLIGRTIGHQTNWVIQFVLTSVVLILLGRYLEARAKGRTGAAIQKLLGLQVRTARVERGDAVVDLPIDDIVAGDVLIVRPGERIAVDGEVIDGNRVVAFDKTGTLTLGRPELTDLIPAPGFSRADVLPLIAAVEQASEHPVGEAILRAARAAGMAVPRVADFNSVTGHGVQGTVGGHAVAVGADRLMTREGVDISVLAKDEARLAREGKTALFAAIDGRLAAVIAVSDPVKPTTAAAIAALHAQGLRVAMITGDKRATAEAIGSPIGIDHIVAGVLPDGKVAALSGLRAEGKLAFVGDGINDAPALAHADVGIAIGTGTDIAIESADVVLMSGDLGAVVNAFEVSRRTMRNIRENLFWAFGYNTALIPVAAGALYPAFGLMLSPILAAGAMALSSVFVLTNALRLRRIAPAMREGPRAAAEEPDLAVVAAP